MKSWRNRLCGTEVLRDDEEAQSSLAQFKSPSPTMSCGGGFFPNKDENLANMSTYRVNFHLPTDAYSVLVFREDGSAVIYSDSEEAPSSPEMTEEAMVWPKL